VLASTLKETEAKLATSERRLEEHRTENKRLRQEAKETFAVLQQKLTAARNGTLWEETKRQLEDSEAEKQDLQSTIDQLESAAKELAGNYQTFIETLGRLLGCEGMEAIVGRVRELVLLPSQLEKLRLDMIEMRNRRMGDVHEGYEAVIDALKQVRDNLSPDSLRLSEDSVLRQLFASFCNLVTALSKPVESRKVLMPHVRALVFQARVFRPEM
jgi:chromosome segregation ATPase